jgi:hypothetical protein
VKLTARNYYSTKANQEFFSVSQFKAFQKCEASAMAELKGEYTPDRGRALILGSFVDEMLTGTRKSQMKFIEENQGELLKKNGEYYADVAQAVEAVERVKAQPLMMKYLNGGHQKIMTGEIEGVLVKGKFDSYKPGEFIADLKYLKDFKSPNMFENAISYYSYDMQLAVYRELVRQNTGILLPCYLVIVTKQEPPDVAVAEINSYDLDNALDKFKKQIKHFQAVKNGDVVAERCESHDCPYCRATRILKEPIDSSILGMSRKQIEAMAGVM